MPRFVAARHYPTKRKLPKEYAHCPGFDQQHYDITEGVQSFSAWYLVVLKKNKKQIVLKLLRKLRRCKSWIQGGINCAYTALGFCKTKLFKKKYHNRNNGGECRGLSFGFSQDDSMKCVVLSKFMGDGGTLLNNVTGIIQFLRDKSQWPSWRGFMFYRQFYVID